MTRVLLIVRVGATVTAIRDPAVATQWLGLMCATIPASLIMARLGRKRGFMLGNLVGLVGALLATQALISGLAICADSPLIQ